MPVERTLSILKPDAVRRNLTGQIESRIEAAGLRIVAQKRIQMTLAQAQAFRADQAHIGLFKRICAYLISGPIVVQVLEGENAIARYHALIGKGPNPQHAPIGTLRRDFAEGVIENAVHGSDSAESAVWEIAFFFNATELMS